MYEENEDYKYTSYGKIPSNIDYGINAIYNIGSILQIDELETYDINFESLVENAFDAWTDVNAGIELSAGGSTPNNIIFENWERKDANGHRINGHTVENDTIVNGFVSKDVYIYYPNIEDEARRVAEDLNQQKETYIPLIWQATLVHELGHTLGLEDWGNLYEIPEAIRNANPNLYQSIMVYRSNPSEIMVPHEAEFAGVKKAYHQKVSERGLNQ